jgi:hypothetical protein
VREESRDRLQVFLTSAKEPKMRFSDFLNPKTGPEAIVRLSLLPLVVLAVGSLTMTILSELTAAEFLLAMLFFLLMSPLAYAIRERRQGHRQQQRTRQGAERIPLLPPEEEE